MNREQYEMMGESEFESFGKNVYGHLDDEALDDKRFEMHLRADMESGRERPNFIWLRNLRAANAEAESRGR